jgi:hypothetical protein
MTCPQNLPNVLDMLKISYQNEMSDLWQNKEWDSEQQ